MKKFLIVFMMSALLLGMMVSCGKGADSELTAPEADTDQVATTEDMTDIDEVTWDSMVPITADQLNDGEYEINVDSSSSMFKISRCILTVKNGEMSALMTMGGTGYRYIAMMAADEAAKAADSEYIMPEEDAEGKHTFTVPVEALDKGVKCAAFSNNKEKWYDRTLVFRAATLSADSFREGVLTRPSDLRLSDGEYTVEVGLEGGSGKASVTSPTKLVLSDGTATATVEWGSPNYDYMIVEGDKYLPLNTDGNSVFEIPVNYFDRPIFVIADTTAMSKPHEIEYALTFDSKTVK